MEIERKFTQRFSGKINDEEAFKEAIAKIEGVTSCKVDFTENTVKYEINEWASDYDVLSALILLLENFGAEIDFSSVEEVENSIAIEENDEDKTGEPEETEEKDEKDFKKEKRSEFIEKVSIFGISLALFVVGLFFTEKENVNMWLFMFSYVFASYEALFSVITKFIEKKNCAEELFILLPTLVMLYVGNRVFAAAIMLICFITAIVTDILNGKIEEKIYNLKNSELPDEYKNEKVKLYESIYKTTLNEEVFLEKNKTKIRLAFIIFGVLIAFVPPLFKISEYGRLLITKWLFIGSSVVIFGNFSYFGKFVKATYFFGAEALFNRGASIKDLTVFRKIADAEEVVFDGSTVLEDLRVVAVETEREEFNEIVYAVTSKCEIQFFKKISVNFKAETDKTASEIEYKSDKGIICEIDGKKVAIGNKKLMSDFGVSVTDDKYGSSTVFVLSDGELLGSIKIKFFVGNNAYGAVKEINEDLPVNTTLLSSESVATVNTINKELNFKKAIASCTSEYKTSYINKNNCVYFGDGELNEKIISSVDTSVSLGKENVKTLVNLNSKDLKNAPFLLKVSNRTVKTLAFGALFMQFPKILGVLLGTVLLSFSSVNLVWLFFLLDCAVQISSFYFAKLNSRDTL